MSGLNRRIARGKSKDDAVSGYSVAKMRKKRQILEWKYNIGRAIVIGFSPFRKPQAMLITSDDAPVVASVDHEAGAASLEQVQGVYPPDAPT